MNSRHLGNSVLNRGPPQSTHLGSDGETLPSLRPDIRRQVVLKDGIGNIDALAWRYGVVAFHQPTKYCTSPSCGGTIAQEDLLRAVVEAVWGVVIPTDASSNLSFGRLIVSNSKDASY